MVWQDGVGTGGMRSCTIILIYGLSIWMKYRNHIVGQGVKGGSVILYCDCWIPVETGCLLIYPEIIRWRYLIGKIKIKDWVICLPMES